ncbi:MAG: hypothetical protein HYS12_03490, partial [Planctomycetes bacterium]|nr:hypothetical protein [Planctomycetota bacterium]
MPETLTCPECQRKVRLPDHLIGKRVKCPSCGGTFTATPTTMAVPALPTEPEPAVPFEPMPAPVGPVSARPPVEEQEGDLAFPREPEVDIPTADVSAWFGVRMGLRLQVIAHCAVAGGLGLILLLILVTLSASEPSASRGGRSEGVGTFAIILTILSGLSMLTGWILTLVAGCFLLGTTPRRSARELALGMLL